MPTVMRNFPTNRPPTSFSMNRSSNPTEPSVRMLPRRYSRGRSRIRPAKPSNSSSAFALRGLEREQPASHPCWSHGAVGSSPVRRPRQREEFDADVGFDRLDGHGLELLLERIARCGDCLAFGFELRVEIGQLLLQRRDVFL